MEPPLTLSLNNKLMFFYFRFYFTIHFKQTLIIIIKKKIKKRQVKELFIRRLLAFAVEVKYVR